MIFQRAQVRSGSMKLSKAERAILYALWSAETPLPAAEIAKRSNYRFFGTIKVSLTVEGLMEKKQVVQAGNHQDFVQKKTSVQALYAPAISFAEYCAERFKNISPRNLFCLTEKLLHTQAFSPQMLQDLNDVLSERIRALADTR